MTDRQIPGPGTDSAARGARQRPSTSAEATRQALIEAAVAGFGRDGYAGTSTRSIANTAGTNVASIAYHFGGKEGLHRACGEFVMKTLRSVVGPVIEGEKPGDYKGLTREEARARIFAVLERMGTFILSNPRSELIVQFMLREIFAPTEAFEIIYAGVIANAHGKLCDLWAAATGTDPASKETAVLIFALIGQVLYFRIGREVVLRCLDWETIGSGEAGLIGSILTRNVDTLMDAYAREDR